jgi:hypothetical protein
MHHRRRAIRAVHGRGLPEEGGEGSEVRRAAPVEPIRDEEREGAARGGVGAEEGEEGRELRGGDARDGLPRDARRREGGRARLGEAESRDAPRGSSAATSRFESGAQRQRATAIQCVARPRVAAPRAAPRAAALRQLLHFHLARARARAHARACTRGTARGLSTVTCEERGVAFDDAPHPLALRRLDLRRSAADRGGKDAEGKALTEGGDRIVLLLQRLHKFFRKARERQLPRLLRLRLPELDARVSPLDLLPLLVMVPAPEREEGEVSEREPLGTHRCAVRGCADDVEEREDGVQRGGRCVGAESGRRRTAAPAARSAHRARRRAEGGERERVERERFDDSCERPGKGVMRKAERERILVLVVERGRSAGGGGNGLALKQSRPLLLLCRSGEGEIQLALRDGERMDESGDARKACDVAAKRTRARRRGGDGARGDGPREGREGARVLARAARGEPRRLDTDDALLAEEVKERIGDDGRAADARREGRAPRGEAGRDEPDGEAKAAGGCSRRMRAGDEGGDARSLSALLSVAEEERLRLLRVENGAETHAERRQRHAATASASSSSADTADAAIGGLCRPRERGERLLFRRCETCCLGMPLGERHSTREVPHRLQWRRLSAAAKAAGASRVVRNARGIGIDGESLGYRRALLHEDVEESAGAGREECVIHAPRAARRPRAARTARAARAASPAAARSRARTRVRTPAARRRIR